ncbi:MAG: gfo/Idh/MocA family oxidoreductase, partial [Planctomycetaceae bacterium]
METIGIGMVGSGFMGLTYSEVLAKHIPGVRLAAITGGKRAAELAVEYGVPHEPTYESLLARADVAGVVLATPDQYRRELTVAAAAAGKHVLAEKPMAPTVAECDAMIAACQAAHVNLAVVQTERFRKITLKAKEIIDSG